MNWMTSKTKLYFGAKWTRTTNKQRIIVNNVPGCRTLRVMESVRCIVESFLGTCDAPCTFCITGPPSFLFCCAITWQSASSFLSGMRTSMRFCCFDEFICCCIWLAWLIGRFIRWRWTGGFCGILGALKKFTFHQQNNFVFTQRKNL